MRKFGARINQDRETIEAISESNGHILTVIALLFTVKASLFSLVYFEKQNANLKDLCLGNWNTERLYEYSEQLFIPMQLIDFSMYLLPLFLILAVWAPLYRSFRIRPLKILNRTSFYKGFATGIISLVMLVFAFGNYGATMYLKGGVRASLESAPAIERMFKNAQKDEFCSRWVLPRS